jgi:hypothetical protein
MLLVMYAFVALVAVIPQLPLDRIAERKNWDDGKIMGARAIVGFVTCLLIYIFLLPALGIRALPGWSKRIYKSPQPISAIFRAC